MDGLSLLPCDVDIIDDAIYQVGTFKNSRNIAKEYISRRRQAEPPPKYDELYGPIKPHRPELQPLTQALLPLQHHNTSQTPIQSPSPHRIPKPSQPTAQLFSKRQEQMLPQPAVQARSAHQEPESSRSSVPKSSSHRNPETTQPDSRLMPRRRGQPEDQNVDPPIPGAWPAELRPSSSIVIAVCGMTGTGKSTFIGKVTKKSVGVGHGLRSRKSHALRYHRHGSYRDNQIHRRSKRSPARLGHTSSPS